MNNYTPPLQGTANNLAKYGRYGDSMLVHMNPIEVQGIAALSPRGLTTNPVTGQPEAWSFLIPMLGSMLGSAAWGGAIGPAAAGAIGSGLSRWAQTGDFEKGLASGITGFGMGKLWGSGKDLVTGADKAATGLAETGEAISDMGLDPARVGIDGGAITGLTQEQMTALQPVLDEQVVGDKIVDLKDLLTERAGFQADLAAAPSKWDDLSFGEKLTKPFTEPGGLGAMGKAAMTKEAILPIAIGGGETARQTSLEELEGLEGEQAERGRRDRQRQMDILRGAWEQIGRDYPGYDNPYSVRRAAGGGIISINPGDYSRRRNELSSLMGEPVRMQDEGRVPIDPLAAAARQASIRGSEWVAPPEFNVAEQPWRAGFDPEHLYFERGKDIGFSPVGPSAGARVLAPEDVSELPTQQTVVGGSAMVPSAVPNTSVGSVLNPINQFPTPRGISTPRTDFISSLTGKLPVPKFRVDPSGLGLTRSTPYDFDPDANDPYAQITSESPTFGTVYHPDESGKLVPAVSEEDPKFLERLWSGIKGAFGGKDEGDEGDEEESGIGSLLSGIRGKGGWTGGGKPLGSGASPGGMGYTAPSTATAGRAAATAGPLAGSLSGKDDSGFQYESRREAAMDRRDAQEQFIKDLYGEEERNINPNVDFEAALAQVAGGKPGGVLQRGSIPMTDMVLADPSKARLLRELLRGDARTMRDGGIVRMQDEGIVPGGGITDLAMPQGPMPQGPMPLQPEQAMQAMQGPMPGGENQAINALVEQTAMAVLGQIPPEQAEIVIQRFIDEFGQEAFQMLRQQVLSSVVPGAQTEGMIEGQGDGTSDEIMGMIGDQQRVAVSPGEFVVPADVVSGIGNGSTDAGAAQLDGMMDQVRQARTGVTQQPPDVRPEEVLPV